jgi:hypothetical protein
MHTVGVDNSILLDYLTCEVALEEPEIGSTNTNIPLDIHCMADELMFQMPGGSGDSEDDSRESDTCDAFPTTSQRQHATTELERFWLETSDVDGCGGDHGNEADENENIEASHAIDVSMQNMEDSGHSTGCGQWVLV